jgi:hypothetical protein
MRPEDRLLARRMREQAPEQTPPDFDAMWQRAHDIAHAANDEPAPAPSRRRAALIAAAALILGVGAWWQLQPSAAIPAAPSPIARVEPAPVAPPTPVPELPTLAPELAQVSDVEWDAPTDFLLAEGGGWDNEDRWEGDAWDVVWDEALDETLDETL